MVERSWWFFSPRCQQFSPFLEIRIASQGAPVNGWDESGWTALHYSPALRTHGCWFYHTRNHFWWICPDWKKGAFAGSLEATQRLPEVRFFFNPRWKLLSPGNASSLREPRRLQCCVELSRNETNITFPCFHECQPDIARSIWEHLQYFAIISLCTCWMLLPMFLKAGDVERNQNCGQLCKPLLVRFCQTSPLHWCLRWTRWNRQVFLKNSTAMIHYDMSGN